MKRYNHSICLIILVLLVFTLPIWSHADNVVIYGCYQKINGQLRIVSNTNQCLPSELPVSWVAQSGQFYGPLTLYVNGGASGQDQPGYGKSASTPFKTISYALSQVPLLRNPEYRATINVAAGTYRESFNISLSSVSIVGAGSESTEIIGTPTEPVVEVYSRGAVLSKLKITNGNIGIYAERATLTVTNCIIQNSQGLASGGFAGITVNYNTSLNLNNSQIHSNTGNGVFIYRGSSLVAENVSISDNGGSGIDVWYTALARVNNSQIERNSKDGIGVWASSSLQLLSSTIQDNTNDGINVSSASSGQLRGGNVIRGNNLSGTSWRGGIGIRQGAEVSIAPVADAPSVPPDQIIDNYENGISLANNSTIIAITALIENNSGNGVILDFACSGQFENAVTIRNNSGYGIICTNAVLRNTANVSGNGGTPDVFCPYP
jgi:hypothetical protein